MSIALERGGNGAGAGGFIACIPVYDSVEVGSDERRVGSSPEERSESSSCSSSIGRNSDCSVAGAEDDGGEEAEVQSPYKGPLDTMDSLEDSLPIRRGVSKYYCGKSKSFTSLADASSSCVSAKDLAKPENPFNRKRKNLLASTTTWDKTRQCDNSPRRSIECSSISKRSANSSRSSLNLTASTSSSGSNDNSSEDEHEPPRLLPPLHPRSRPAASPALFTSYPHEKPSFPTTRSFSLTDLEGVDNSGFSLGPRDEHKRF